MNASARNAIKQLFVITNQGIHFHMFAIHVLLKRIVQKIKRYIVGLLHKIFQIKEEKAQEKALI